MFRHGRKTSTVEAWTYAREDLERNIFEPTFDAAADSYRRSVLPPDGLHHHRGSCYCLSSDQFSRTRYNVMLLLIIAAKMNAWVIRYYFWWHFRNHNETCYNEWLLIQTSLSERGWFEDQKLFGSGEWDISILRYTWTCSVVDFCHHCSTKLPDVKKHWGSITIIRFSVLIDFELPNNWRFYFHRRLHQKCWKFFQPNRT